MLKQRSMALFSVAGRVDHTTRVATEPRGVRLAERAALLPWLLLAAVVLGGLLIGYYSYQRHRIALDEADALRGMLASSSAHAAGTDERLMHAEAQLSRARGELGHPVATPCSVRAGAGAVEASAAVDRPVSQARAAIR